MAMASFCKRRSFLDWRFFCAVVIDGAVADRGAGGETLCWGRKDRVVFKAHPPWGRGGKGVCFVMF
jgi:hypothetical protein